MQVKDGHGWEYEKHFMISVKGSEEPEIRLSNTLIHYNSSVNSEIGVFSTN